jgi:hypothetical protein
MKTFVGEKLSRDTTQKKTYRFVDTNKKIDQISREVFKKSDMEVHFPIGFDGGQKYSNLKKIVFKGFKGKLPVGVLKSVTRVMVLHELLSNSHII